MRIIRPITITESLITASNIEPEAIPDWYSDAPPIFDLPDARILPTSLSAAANTTARSALAFNYAELPPAIRVFDTSSYALVAAPELLQPTARITGLAFSADDAYLAVTCCGSTANGLRALYVFDTSDWSLAHSEVGDVWLSADWTANYLVISNDDETRVIDTSWSVVTTLPSPLGANRTQLGGATTCSNNYIAIKTATSTLTIYDGSTFAVVRALNIPNGGDIGTYRISDAKAVVTATLNVAVGATIYVFDIATGAVDNSIQPGTTNTAIQAARDLSVIRSGRAVYDATLTKLFDYPNDYAAFNLTSNTITAIADVDPKKYRLLDSTTGSSIDGDPTNYLTGETVVFDGIVYESLADSNTDVPSIGVNLDPPTWLKIGVINPLRPFDKIASSVATNPGSIDVSIAPGVLTNAAALFDVRSDTVRLSMNDPVEGLVYDTGAISTLSNSSIDNLYSYFFEPYTRQVDFAFTDLPAYPDATVRVELPRAGESATVAEIILGSLYELGTTVYGTSSGIIDYSRKDTDEFGNVDIQVRGYSKRIDYDVMVESDRTDNVIQTLSEWRSQPIVWIGGKQSRTGILAYGFYRDFDITYSNPAMSEATITVEGLQRGEVS